MTYQPNGVRNSVRAIGYATVAGPASPGALLRVSAIRGPSTIAGPSRSFIELTRNIKLAEQAPRRFEPTVKGEGDIVL